jgi:hypothetical protein
MRPRLVLVLALVPAVLALCASHLAVRHYGRTLGSHTARTVAAYIRVAAPAARSPGRGYDLPALLIRVRGLDALPLTTRGIEVYAATAPLMHAAAPPLPPSALAGLRHGATPLWLGGTVLVPLRAPGDSIVVGAVSVRAPDLAPLWPGGFGLPALLLLLPVALRRTSLRNATPEADRYLLVAALVGSAVYADARWASYASTSRWLDDTRTLLQEAAWTAGPRTLTELAPLAGEGALLGQDKATRAVGTSHVPLRLGSVRADLRAPRDPLRPWLFLLFPLALIGPCALRLGIVRPVSRRRGRRASTARRRPRPAPRTVQRDPTQAS